MFGIKRLENKIDDLDSLKRRMSDIEARLDEAKIHEFSYTTMGKEITPQNLFDRFKLLVEYLKLNIVTIDKHDEIVEKGGPEKP